MTMRQKHSRLLIFNCFWLALSFQSLAFALRIDEATYQYPYKAPYLATSTIAIMNGSKKPPTSEIRDIHLKVLENRNHVYLLEGMGTLRYRFYQREGLAPLIYIIPGLAGSAYTGTAIFLAEWLVEHGFHVLILPSPFNWNFTLAASTSGVPGYTQEDTQDLYTVMQRVLDDIKTHYHAKLGKIGILGMSDGALYTAYLTKLDGINRKIDADTFLLVNPPVDLFEAAKKLDDMVDIGKDFDLEQKINLEAYASGVVLEAISKDSHNPAYFADWDKRLKLSDKQIAYLIGKTMRDAVGDAIYVMDIANDLDILQAPISWADRSGRLAEAHAYSIMDYVQTFLLPSLQRTGHNNLSIKALDNLNSLKGVTSVLKKKQNVFLMHNLDDILVSEPDVAYLEKVFAERAMIYPHGGHMGNLWYPDNKLHILEVFSSLKQDSVPVKPR